MELIFSLAIGILTGAGVWLVLRSRTLQVIVGLTILSYAINLFIFGGGMLNVAMLPIINPDVPVDVTQYADPIPQALVLTAIVIGFATTALYLVILLAQRGLTNTDHIDGSERN